MANQADELENFALHAAKIAKKAPQNVHHSLKGDMEGLASALDCMQADIIYGPVGELWSRWNTYNSLAKSIPHVCNSCSWAGSLKIEKDWNDLRKAYAVWTAKHVSRKSSDSTRVESHWTWMS